MCVISHRKETLSYVFLSSFINWSLYYLYFIFQCTVADGKLPKVVEGGGLSDRNAPENKNLY